MSLLVLGLSHHQAPMELLEQVTADQDSALEFEKQALAGEHVREAMVLSTCNRTELYAEAVTFHGALTDLTSAFTAITAIPLNELQPHLYVHYEERGVAHTFNVASGLDSMAIGEAQILGQLRVALRRAQAHGHIGPSLNVLFQQALRVAKRVHSETGIDSASRSLVDAALERAGAVHPDLSETTVLVVGAGGMGALAATAATRRGIDRLLIANRSPQRAISLAERLAGEAVAWADLDAALPHADIVLSSTGARGLVIDEDRVAAAMAARAGRPQVYVDLALPRDVDPLAADVDGVTLMDLGDLGSDLSSTGQAPEVKQAADLVTAEVAEYVTSRAAVSVAPTVSALRRRANAVVEAELARFHHRAPDLTEVQRKEVEHAVHRVVEKLLHAPTVRVKELAEQGQGGSYARALSELFDLDPRHVSLVSAPVQLLGEDA